MSTNQVVISSFIGKKESISSVYSWCHFIWIIKKFFRQMLSYQRKWPWKNHFSQTLPIHSKNQCSLGKCLLRIASYYPQLHYQNIKFWRFNGSQGFGYCDLMISHRLNSKITTEWLVGWSITNKFKNSFVDIITKCSLSLLWLIRLLFSLFRIIVAC